MQMLFLQREHCNHTSHIFYSHMLTHDQQLVNTIIQPANHEAAMHYIISYRHISEASATVHITKNMISNFHSPSHPHSTTQRLFCSAVIQPTLECLHTGPAAAVVPDLGLINKWMVHTITHLLCQSWLS